MGGEQPALTGPDLTKGITADLVDEGRLLLGHADGEPVMLTRCNGEVLAVGAAVHTTEVRSTKGSSSVTRSGVRGITRPSVCAPVSPFGLPHSETFPAGRSR